MYLVDIDTGGTMTDCLVSGPGRLLSLKVDTTPHDYTVSFSHCLRDAASQLGFAGTAEFLEQVTLIRWSSTITTNVLGERRGAKVGLLVERGHERDLYGDGVSPALGWLVQGKNVLGLPADPTEQDLLASLKQLLEDGVRRVCVCLKGAYPDNARELAIEHIVERHYPDHYLGAVPLLLGSEMAQVTDDNTRAHYSLINAYTHTQLATSLFKAEDLLKQESRWEGPLLIGHTSGGVARVGKTKAVDTIESGPVFGTFGAAYLAGLYRVPAAVCLDVGGTTTKASIALDGKPVYQRGGALMEVPVKSRFALLRSAVLGGGSIARTRAGRVQLGPESMGAAPGPACYGLGGQEATLTDALLTVGYLDPKAFLGGRRELRRDLAAQAIDTALAQPLGASVQQAAQRVVDRAVRIIVELMQATLAEAGLTTSEVVLIAYGGNGPLFAALVAQALGVSRVHVPALSPVFSAFGSAISDVLHVYERGLGVATGSAQPLLRETMDRMRTQACRDLQGEGFDPAHAGFEFECEATAADGRIVTATTAAAATHEIAVQTIIEQLAQTRRIDLVRLAARHAVSSYKPERLPETVRAAPAPQGTRAIMLGGSERSAKLYAWDGLAPGQQLQGPAVVAGGSMTCLVPPGMRFTLDGYGTGTLETTGSTET